MPSGLQAAAKLLAAALVLPVLLVFAAAARLRASAELPHVVWGPTPIITIKYWSEALRRRGHNSTTLVWPSFPINQRSDFDRAIADFPPRTSLLRFLRPYAAFIWVLRQADIVSCFFDGGYLAPTPLRLLELPLLRAAGKRIVVSPYGSDIAVPGTLGPFEEPMLEAYPGLADSARKKRRRIDEFCRWADFVVRNLQVGYLPRYDLFWPTQVCVDTDEWTPQDEIASVSTEGLRVVHSSNHRPIKGTEALVNAVAALRSEGLSIELELFEGRPNHEVREGVSRSDVVVDQLIGGYGLAAIEAMSAGKPVVSNLSWLGAVRTTTVLRACPIVDASASDVRSRLRELVEDDDRRRALGMLGRSYVLDHHSYEAAGRIWEAIVRHVWSADPLPDDPLEPQHA